jgi:phage virion morphogenesis protein
MPVHGDFAKLRRVKQQLATVKSKKLHLEVSRQVAHETLTLISDGFRGERDPYGDAWAELLRRSGRILSDTGRLRNSFTVKHVTARGFTVGSSVKYAAFHQHGTRRMKRRMMVPLPKKLPTSWARSYHETIAEVVRDHFKA